MKNIFSLNSPFMKLLREFTDLMILNILWLLGCLPVITIGASTTALYQCIIKLKKGEEGRPWSEFWKYFRGNFKQATILFLIVAVLTALTALDLIVIFTLMPNTGIVLKILMILPFLLVIPALGYVFPLQAFFDNGIIQTLKNAWIMSIIHILVSIIVLGINLIPVVIFLFYPELFMRCVPLWVCLAGSVIAYANMSFLQSVFTQYIPKEASDSVGD